MEYNFNDICAYNNSMAQVLEDKLFFLKHLSFNPQTKYLIVDFGCADGTIIDALYKVFSDKKINATFIGYDKCETMIELAKNKFNHSTNNVYFTSNWNFVDELLDNSDYSESILILSSVIHEVYSYAESEKDIELFWKRILNSNFKYICVRDMMCSIDAVRKSKYTDVHKIKDVIKFKDLQNNLTEFERLWGSISNNLQLIHFLLKYRWTINWNREVHENYFPIYISDFLNKMQEYNLIYLKRFRVQYLDDCIKKDWNIELEDYTHVKIIFEKQKQYDS